MTVNRISLIVCVAVGVVVVALAVVAAGQAPGTPRQVLPSALAKPAVKA